MILSEPSAAADPLRQRLRGMYRADETAVVEQLLQEAELPAELQDRIAAGAPASWCEKVRRAAGRPGRHRRLPARVRSSPAARAWC